METQATATLYRMAMRDHMCPSGLKAKQLLEMKGYVIEDRLLETREATDAFKKKHSVKTTPQVWIGEERIGGFDDLRAHFGENTNTGDTSYSPVIAIFSVAALMAEALSYAFQSTILSVLTVEWFVAISVCFLAVQKLQDVDTFAVSFLNYDLLAQRWAPYAKLYPYIEALGGVLMLAGILMWLAAPIMLFVGTIGAISVFKAVYLDKRELKCACVGGDSNVPLGFVSLTENLFMAGMGIWMLVKWIG